MKYIHILFLFLASYSSAQGTRIVYDYHFIPNLLKKDSLTKEIVYLDIQEQGSKFFSQKQFLSDSLREEYFKNMRATGAINTNFTGLNPGLVKYTVTKSYPNFTTLLLYPINRNNYAIKNEQPIQWNIQQETKRIDKFTAQKATTNFGGRIWTAWFTQELNFQDGPYKFSGLPGLILEMQDATETHRYQFMGIKKLEKKSKTNELDTTPNKTIVVIGNSNDKPIEISEARFLQLWKAYKNDPVKDMRQLLGQGNVKMKLNIDGKELSDPNEILRTMEKNQRENIKNDNNPIEPSLFP